MPDRARLTVRDQPIQRVRDDPILPRAGVQTDQRSTRARCPTKWANDAPDSADSVFPVWRRSWKCRSLTGSCSDAANPERTDEHRRVLAGRRETPPGAIERPEARWPGLERRAGQRATPAGRSAARRATQKSEDTSDSPAIDRPRMRHSHSPVGPQQMGHRLGGTAAARRRRSRASLSDSEVMGAPTAC